MPEHFLKYPEGNTKISNYNIATKEVLRGFFGLGGGGGVGIKVSFILLNEL